MHFVEGVLERQTRNGSVARIGLPAGEIGIGADLALESYPSLLPIRSDFLLGAHQGPLNKNMWSFVDHRACPVQLFGRIDAERHRVDERDVDAHAGFERAQLLEL